MTKRYIIHIAKWTGIILLRLFILGLILLSTRQMQSFLTRSVVSYMRTTYHLDIEVAHVDVRLLNHLQFEDILLRDQQGDTLMYVGQARARISGVKPFKRKLFIEEIILDAPHIRAEADSTGIYNFDYLLEIFGTSKTKDTTDVKSFHVFCETFSLKNAELFFKDHRESPTPGILNPGDIHVKGFDISVGEFQMLDSDIELELKHLAFQEKSGFRLNGLEGYLSMNDSLINMQEVLLKTGHSYLQASHINVEIHPGDSLDIWNDFVFDVKVDTSILSVKDAGYFVPDMQAMTHQVGFGAHFKGPLSNVKVSDFHLHYGCASHVLADFSVNGLPDTELAFVFAEINDISLFEPDIRNALAETPGVSVELPEGLSEMGSLQFKGTLTGMFNDLVAYGMFESDAGSISTDLAVSSDFQAGNYDFKGDIAVHAMQFGALLSKPELLGVVSMRTHLKGSYRAGGKYDMDMKLHVDSAELKKYMYHDLSAKGLLTEKSFDGELMIQDTNLKLQFLGKYDMNVGIPDLDFRADIHANLDELNITDSLDSEVGFVLISDFKGDGINTAEGFLELGNITYRQGTDTLNLQKLAINTYTLLDEQYLDVQSDIFSFSMHGLYDLMELSASLPNLYKIYFPVMDSAAQPEKILAGNKSRIYYDFSAWHLSELTDMFLPGLTVKDSLHIEGELNAENDKYSVNLSCNALTYDTIQAEEVAFRTDAGPEALKVTVEAGHVYYGSLPFFYDYRLEANAPARSDSLHMQMIWKDTTERPDDAGNIRTSLKLEDSGKPMPRLLAHVFSSNFVLNKETWHIAPSNIEMDSTSMQVDSLYINNGEQQMKLIGGVSETRDKSLSCMIQNIDISVLNPLIAQNGYQLQGELNAYLRLLDVYDALNFSSYANITDVFINEEDIGDIDLDAGWDNLDNAFEIDLNSRYFDVKGNAMPSENSMALSLLMENFGLSVLEPYTKNFGLHSMTGMLDGELHLNGSISNPRIEGALDFDRAGLTYELLQARFNLNDSVYIYTDSVVFDRFTVADAQDNEVVINGRLTHNKFKDIRYHFDIEMNNYHILNTNSIDNSVYYGDAYAEGQATIKGTTEQLDINIDATTKRGTVFNLPLIDSYESSEYSWLHFVEVDSLTKETIAKLEEENNIDLSFAMNLQVTPDATANIIFDPMVGGEISARCNGLLSMNYNSGDEEFKMKGTLNIEDGNYLFSLQNLVQKRFYIQDGSSISWSGDIYSGQLDLDAIYRTNAPLYDIMVGIDTSANYKQRTQVDCIMGISGTLEEPHIALDIEVPNADQKAKSRLESLSQDEINKQLVMLLVLNRFYTPYDVRSDFGMKRSSNAAGVTTFEMLSNQISSWLSQISNDFDIGINYQPGDEITAQEVELALSTQILNDRVLVNGKMGYGEYQSNSNNLVGDMEVQVKLTEQGNLRFTGFNRANRSSQYEYDYGLYTQGFGLYYTESFNTFGGLMRKYWSGFTSIFKKKSEEDQVQ